MIIDMDARASLPAEAEDLVARVYKQPEIRGTPVPFAFRQRSLGDERANLTRFSLSADATIRVVLDGVVGIGHLHAGDFRAESNGQAVDARAPFVLRPGEARSWSEGMDLTMVNLDLRELSAYASALDGRPAADLRFDHVAAVSAASAAHWQRSVAHVHAVFNDPELLTNDIIRRSAIDLLFAAGIAAFAPPAGEGARRSSADAPRAVRRAVQFIEDNAHMSISLTDIADAAGLSVRGLQAAFRRSLSTTPVAYLRTVRLDHARAELIAATPSTTTVAAVARRWGFPHLGRFAAAYRDAFGELPRDTLVR